MTRQQLFEQIQKKRSFLCVGLDSDLDRIPEHLKNSPNPILEFNKQIIGATKDHCIAYKFNIAFYEALGAIGWDTMQKTLELIPDNIFTIADAKRGDIGNTSKKYAEAFFKALNFDSITLSPYMGEDTVKPFLQYDGKWSILLALTSNSSSKDFQFLETDNTPLFQTVTKKISEWGTPENTMLVVGATQTEHLSKIRSIVPNHFLLVPGIGAQGGKLEEVCKLGLNDQCGLLVNSSRGIIYAGNGENFAQSARDAAMDIQQEMEKILEENQLI